MTPSSELAHQFAVLNSVLPVAQVEALAMADDLPGLLSHYLPPLAFCFRFFHGHARPTMQFACARRPTAFASVPSRLGLRSRAVDQQTGSQPVPCGISLNFSDKHPTVAETAKYSRTSRIGAFFNHCRSPSGTKTYSRWTRFQRTHRA
jgi:hypothetical protein